MNAQALPQKRAPMLGRYRLLLELGHGGMAHVYLALVTGLGGFTKLVVLKVMRDELREHPASLNMFLGEARLAARMNHVNVVQTTEVGEDGGRYFICMEYLEGQTLSRLLRKTIDGVLPLGARLEIMCQMLEGLSYLHGFCDLDGTPLGLVHRDISPNNIFVTFDGGVKVLDFGVAKAAGISHVTETGTFKGKLGYAAPEQIVGRSDQRSDVFAAGVLLWEILTYRRLTQDRTQTEIVQGRIAGAESELMLERGSGVAPELMAICAKAAAKSPQDRYASAAEMRDAIRQYASANSLEFPPDKLRDLLHEIYQQERVEMRRQIDQRVKLMQLEDEHPSQFTQTAFVPNAAAVFGGTSTGSTPAPAPKNRLKLLGAGAVIALLAGALGAFATRLEPRNVAPATPLASAAKPPPAENVAEKPLVRLEISADPAAAELSLDGAKLEGNPFSGSLPRDGSLHRLEARASGHRSEARMIHLDQDVSLHLALAPASSTAARAAPPRAVSLRPAASVTPAKSPQHRDTGSNPDGDFVHKTETKSLRPIDNADPYGP